LRKNEYFRKNGLAADSSSSGDYNSLWKGDFAALKDIVTEYEEGFNPLRGHYFPVRDILIKIHQYLIAKFDVDAFRIDTLQFVEPEFASKFGNAVREFSSAIGKKNFFTFGEVWTGDEWQIARYFGRDTRVNDEFVGVDAALDFPLRGKLSSFVKGTGSSFDIKNMYDYRKKEQQYVVSSHGEASRFFVTFLDNHDSKERFNYQGKDEQGRENQGKYDSRFPLGIAGLFTIQGIPAIYYGTEQGLCRYGIDVDVREALWGKPGRLIWAVLFIR
jgi:glycosidase